MTRQQQKALHLYYRLVSDAFNDAGLDMRMALKPEVEIPWTPDWVKEFLWRPVQRALAKKESTKDLDSKELNSMIDVMNRHLGEKFGFTEPFPSLEEILHKQRLMESSV